MNFQDDDFALFSVPQQFAQDANHLHVRWTELQRQAHPDKFIAQGAAAQRVAMQWSVRINEAYQRLKSPRHRAAYLCALHGELISAEESAAMPTNFLIQQMELREVFEEASNETALLEIFQTVAQLKKELLKNCEQYIDVQKNYPAAATEVRALMFVEKFASDIQRRLDEIV